MVIQKIELLYLLKTRINLGVDLANKLKHKNEKAIIS